MIIMELQELAQHECQSLSDVLWPMKNTMYAACSSAHDILFTFRQGQALAHEAHCLCQRFGKIFKNILDDGVVSVPFRTGIFQRFLFLANLAPI